ncbi:hypothetical protein [Fischerella sp. JS2]|uniref:hypothetical protein n=1 Tax=Fischerella sp. JS2 TaxID=2597771 RepID=UPI0028EE1A45|nr:hypothetical protein [Fischerella sp. JS2]
MVATSTSRKRSHYIYVYIIVHELLEQFCVNILMARKGGNPNIKNHGFEPAGEEPLTKTLSIRVSESTYQEVKSKDNPGEFCRQAIQKALDEDKRKQNDTPST